MMQVPPYGLLMPKNLRRAPTDEAKYVRMEFGDKDPAWFTAEANRCNGKERTPSGEARCVALDTPSEACALKGRTARY